MARTILIADDSPLRRKALHLIFAKEDGYVLCPDATNGQEAIELATKHCPELIILDLSMPIVNGLQASQRLKRIMPAVPIILFTQFADVATALFVDGLPVDRIVSKNDASRLMDHVRELIPA